MSKLVKIKHNKVNVLRETLNYLTVSAEYESIRGWNINSLCCGAQSWQKEPENSLNMSTRK